MKMPPDSAPAVPTIGSAPAINFVFQQAVVAFEEEAP